VYNDHETNFYQMGARFYGAGMGRFTQMDPRPSSVLEANRYQYARCDPANNIDPTGPNHTSCSWSVAACLERVMNFGETPGMT